MTTYRDYDPMMGVGYFDVWMEGNSFSNPASGSFAATLFRIVYDGTAGTFTVSQAGGPYSLGATNGIRWNQSVAGTGGSVKMIEARIEDATLFNQDNATVSFYASAATDGTPFQVEVVQFFGSGGNPSGPGGNASSDVVAKSEWFTASSAGPSLKTLTFAMPSTQGKYFGVNMDDCLKVRFKFPHTSAFDVTLNEFRIERGSERTPFSHVPLSLKRGYIDRYLQVLNIHIGSHAAAANVYHYQSIPFRANMRRIPTPSWSGNLRANLFASAPENGLPVATYLKQFGGSAYIRSAAAGAFYALDEYLKLDARL